MWGYRVAVVVLPLVAYFLAKRVCEELRANELRPFGGLTGSVVARAPSGGFEAERRRPG